MAQASELPKTSQPSIAKLDEILTPLKEQGYTHALGLFLWVCHFRQFDDH